jgi:hypothetical protein
MGCDTMDRPRLKWQRTWTDGDPDDYTADGPDHPMLHARIYRLSVPAQAEGEWSWAVGEDTYPVTGTAQTAREAALAAEAACSAHHDVTSG